MRDFGRLHCCFWEQPDIAALSLEARLLGVYLITSQHSNMLGCYRLSVGYAMDDLRLAQDATQGAFQELEAHGMALRCQDTGWVLIPSYLKYNPIENPNQAKAVAKLLDKVPSHATFIPALRDAVQRHGGPYTPILLTSTLFSMSVVGQSGVTFEEPQGTQPRMSPSPATAGTTPRGPSRSTAGVAVQDPGLGSPGVSSTGAVPPATLPDANHSATLAEPFRNPIETRNSNSSSSSRRESLSSREDRAEREGVPGERSQAPPPTAEAKPPPPAGHRSAARGARLSTLGLTALPSAWKDFCLNERPELDPERLWARFVDHWNAEAGERGVKRDWLATWRNWVRNERRESRHGGAESALERRAAINAKWRRLGQRAFDEMVSGPA